jgi:hypothetical protein
MPLLASALRIVHVCLDLFGGMNPSLAAILDLEFLLSIEDDTCLCLAVDIICVGLRSPDMGVRVAKCCIGPLLGIAEQGPFVAQVAATTVLGRLLNVLDGSDLAGLVDVGFFERLVMCIEASDRTLFVRELLLAFNRLVRIMPESRAFVAERWDVFEPLLGVADGPTSSYAYLLKNMVFDTVE